MNTFIKSQYFFITESIIQRQHGKTVFKWRKICSRLGTNTAWPSDETGKSSVAPCSSPMKSACHQLTGIYC